MSFKLLKEKINSLIAESTLQTLGRWLPLEFEGLENLPEKEPFLLASNHMSSLDGLILCSIVYRKRPISPVTTRGLFVPPLSWILNNVQAIPVDRASTNQAKTLDRILEALKSKPVLIFPEGGRSVEGRILKPKPGVGYLAAHAKVPVFAAVIEGTQHVLPKGAKFLHRHPVKIRIGKEVDFGTFERSTLPLKSTYQAMAERVMWEIGELRASEKDF
jgi:1-acyl-sn-glycerol-3-phosphate acyltransferase